MPKIVDHAQRRTEIVHALWQVIYLRGIDAVSFRSVAEAAGISIGRVQHYFPSRRELVLEGCRQIAAGAEAPEPGDGDASAEAVGGDAGAEGDASAEAVGGDAGAEGDASAEEGSAGYERAMDRLREFFFAFIPAGEAMRIGASVWYTYVARAVMDREIGEIIRAIDRGTLDLAARHCRRAAAGADDADIRRWAMRMIAMAKGLAQEVMLDERSAASARETLDEELAGFESWWR
ncbi:TetR/AcrR family transcriptional regulator [Brevibacterium sp. SMBL_HHYL_HB1]|uniref:TetR/AcrR family transcriptional regulator n=1 Tax=Brevibacterium sp. SMBL_HHYL_HB1 TaxID=2777556 RepID=UPI001BA8C04E|nr:TetR/AcrR family transcriptional regulator [Brevibacterium sp. SMBL_HHYL_HB1]QUL78633.1 TetR/AcrR family transcriptional regulator [Brevibacterium sp. SMBL_HHYL_HB1]